MASYVRNNAHVNLWPGFYKGVITDVVVTEHKVVKGRRKSYETQSLMVKVCIGDISEVYRSQGWTPVADISPDEIYLLRKSGGYGVDQKHLKCMADICILKRDGTACFRGIKLMSDIFKVVLPSSTERMREFDYKQAIVGSPHAEVVIRVYSEVFMKQETLKGDLYPADYVPKPEEMTWKKKNEELEAKRLATLDRTLARYSRFLDSLTPEGRPEDADKLS